MINSNDISNKVINDGLNDTELIEQYKKGTLEKKTPPARVLFYMDSELNDIVNNITKKNGKGAKSKFLELSVRQMLINGGFLGDTKTDNIDFQEKTIAPKDAITQSFSVITEYIQNELAEGPQDSRIQASTIQQLQKLINNVKLD
ncbi:hypothetical protein SFC66_04570 [Terribacillus saccharophilus]|uniref:hypothetical protein n=1 Tax=Terribacillus saccharophilus TaxID=361277 RepID=UPI00398254BE